MTEKKKTPSNANNKGLGLTVSLTRLFAACCVLGIVLTIWRATENKMRSVLCVSSRLQINSPALPLLHRSNCESTC